MRLGEESVSSQMLSGIPEVELGIVYALVRPINPHSTLCHFAYILCILCMHFFHFMHSRHAFFPFYAFLCVHFFPFYAFSVCSGNCPVLCGLFMDVCSAKIKNIEATEEAKQRLLKERRDKRANKDGTGVGHAPTNVAVNYVQHNRCTPLFSFRFSLSLLFYFLLLFPPPLR